MAEAPESEPMPSSSEGGVGPDVKDADEPLTKKRKITEKEGSDKLEHRLGGILCCAVCLDLPQAAVYQCSNGHLMCAPCFTHLLADARLRDEAATCPNCRVEISKTSASRNLAVEKTVSELPSECKYCTCVFPRHSLQHHEENTCEERLTGCRFACIGCPWLGPAHEARAHEAACAHPGKSAADVVATLAERERRARDAHAVYSQVLDLLSYEKITFNDLQLKPYRTEEFVHKLYYETSRFSAFGHQWVVKAFVNKNQRDPTQSSQREITYQAHNVPVVQVMGCGAGAGRRVTSRRHTPRYQRTMQPHTHTLTHTRARARHPHTPTTHPTHRLHNSKSFISRIKQYRDFYVFVI
ncbi:cysteine and histidine-rich protein 1 homolog isoform X1 [Helicoverpa zea]|uniref:cysteine and histidine-rich protein 1 homolog isoform X1 n=1 Tax=Helicoverpa zea TaxID=7113 RepID=UPI001F5666A3|nr:cysteine and histidine-rich protein 1 homolog isoform X1 [Helicoverpa zea]